MQASLQHLWQSSDTHLHRVAANVPSTLFWAPRDEFTSSIIFRTSNNIIMAPAATFPDFSGPIQPRLLFPGQFCSVDRNATELIGFSIKTISASDVLPDGLSPKINKKNLTALTKDFRRECILRKLAPGLWSWCCSHCCVVLFS